MKASRVLPNREGGFSLIEMVLALGVITFAMVPIFGLIPVGLEDYRVAIQQSVQSAITRELVAELQRTEQGNLSSGSSTHYFNDQGIRCAGADGATYLAQVESPVSLSASRVLPEDIAASSVVIRIRDAKPNGRWSAIPVIIDSKP